MNTTQGLTNEEIIQLAERLKYLADPNRLQIISLISSRPHCVKDIVDRLGLAQNLVSHHLAILRKHKLASFRKDGNKVLYSLDNDAFHAICLELNNIATKPIN